MSTATTLSMPSRGERTAPQFDPKRPRELRRYFADLDVQFVRASVTNGADQKKFACRYVDIDTCEMWESLVEFTDTAKSFNEFKKAVLALYPGSEEERKWSVADMDKLVGERSRLGVISIADLGEYHRQFLAITTFLRAKNRLSEAEQSRAFARGFQPDLWARISQRLQLKLPDHFPDDPYPLNDLHEAARYVLHGTSVNLTMTSPAFATTGSEPSTTHIKTEDVSAMFERLTETFMKALSMQNNQQNSVERTSRLNDLANLICNFCGETGHIMRNCLLCQEYITAGKCKRNTEGKIVLPTGAFIPRDILGKYISSPSCSSTLKPSKTGQGVVQ